MEDLVIKAGKSSPAVEFRYEPGELRIEGESYPEHALKFYEPVLRWVRACLDVSQRSLILTMDIVYFNSSSSKILMNLFDMLDEAASEGKRVSVRWLYHEENEVARECGEEFKEETRFLDFQLVPYGDERA